MDQASSTALAPQLSRFGTVVDYTSGTGSSRRIQGLVYAAVVAGLLPVLAHLGRATFTNAYEALAILAAITCYFSMRHLPLTAAWDTGRRGSAGTELLLIWVKVCVILGLIGLITGYYKDFSGRVMLGWFLTAPATLIVLNHQLRKLIRSGEAVSGETRTAVMAFVNDTARQFAQRLRDSQSHELLGYFEDRTPDRTGDFDAAPCLGATSELADYVRRNNVDVVFIILPIVGADRAIAVADSLGDTTASVFFVPDYAAFQTFHARATEVNSMPALELMETPFWGASSLLKRAFDIAFAACALVALAIPMLTIAALVKLTSPGPALFLQRRYGLNGKEFFVYKFRSMTVANRDSEIQQVTRNDQRVTPLGRFLRRSSLDELPQFINVLLGDMSVVGPRPHTVAHNEYYRGQVQRYMARHKVRPGITGLAQVRGLRGETSTTEMMAARVDCDIEYIRNWSVLLDINIILRTLKVVANDKHAY